MSDRTLRGVILAMESSTLSSLETNTSPRGILKTGGRRSPQTSSSARSPRFDTQVLRSQARGDDEDASEFMIALAGVTADDRPGLRSPRIVSVDDGGISANGQCAALLSPQGSEAKKDQRRSRVGVNEKLKVKTVKTKQPVGLVVALFHDGFVCRHINKESECIEGFAQPYDAESSYFLACIDNGRVPAGLPDMIACAHYNGSVLAEIRDYREMGTAMCPVSSAFLPVASALPEAKDHEPNVACRVCQTLLQPNSTPSSAHLQTSPSLEPPTLQSIFDHFPDVAPSELETLAVDAKRQLLQEEDVLFSSSSTESSPRGGTQRFGLFSKKDGKISRNDDAAAMSTLTTTPTTRSRLQSALEASPPASLLSPLERKSARSTFTEKITTEGSSTTRCKRLIPTKVQGAKQDESNMKSDSTMESPELVEQSQDEEMDECESSGSSSPEPMLLEASITPLPATQYFLSKLKGKRPRPENELLYGKPAWVTIAHVGRFFRAARRLEREHSRFLHVNARRLMQAEKPPPEATEHVSGSMRFLARQLGDLSRPSDVVAVANARKWKAAQDEGRQLRRPDWMDGVSSPVPASERADASLALVIPDNEPIWKFDRIDTEEEQHVCESPPRDAIISADDSQSAAVAPHFNCFDDDGNLQPQIT